MLCISFAQNWLALPSPDLLGEMGRKVKMGKGKVVGKLPKNEAIFIDSYSFLL